MFIKSDFADDLVTIFFKKLNDNSIEYAVLRNYEGHPEKNTSKDIEILFNPSEIDNTLSVLMECAFNLGYLMIWSNPLDYLKGFVFAKVGDSVQTIKFDLFIGLRWRGLDYLSSKKLLDNRKEYNGIYVLDSIDESIVSYFYYTLYEKKIRNKYHNKIINDFKSAEIFDRLQYLFNSNNNQKLIKESISDLNKSVLKNRKKIILKLFMKSFGIKYFIRLLKNIHTEYFLRLKFGYFISFSGPDGVGKSTLVNTLNNILLELGITDKTVPDHLLSEKVPALHKSIIAKKSRLKQKYDKPYSVKPVSYFESFLRSCYYIFIFIYDGFLIFNRKRKNNLVIYDRYIMDFSVDTRRMRIKMPDIFSKLILKLLKFDDFNVVITAEADQILARKDELNRDQLDYLLARYDNLSNMCKRSTIYSNSNNLLQSQKDFLSLIFLNLNKYYLKTINN
jgi:energy-coupling factor transporter ATP-binding protein EcfA2